jgi:hypothetical protein
VGIAYRLLNVHSPFLAYANRLVLPFYILHQTVIIVVGYALNQTNLSLTLKYGSVIFFSLAGILALYEGGIRPFAPMRYLFGMKGD